MRFRARLGTRWSSRLFWVESITIIILRSEWNLWWVYGFFSGMSPLLLFIYFYCLGCCCCWYFWLSTSWYSLYYLPGSIGWTQSSISNSNRMVHFLSYCITQQWWTTSTLNFLYLFIVRNMDIVVLSSGRSVITLFMIASIYSVYIIC